MAQQLTVTCLTILLYLSPEGALCDENALPSSGCLWTWSPWSECDPGPCDSPRNQRDRIRIVTQGPLKRMNESCPFSFGHLDSWVESDTCTTGEPCYWSNTSCHTESGMFQCFSGECIHGNLVSNGDRDCRDGSDEFSVGEKKLPCPKEMAGNIQPLPNSDVWSYGRDLLHIRLGESVLSEGFHGTCDVIPGTLYRKQYNVEDIVPLVDVPKVETVSSFTNWVSFAKHLQKVLKFSKSFTDVYNSLEDLENVTFHEAVSLTLLHRVKLKQPKHLRLKPNFERGLRNLPKFYSYEKYIQFFQTFGTHYFEEATLGGVVRIYFAFDANKFEIRDIEQALYNFMGYLSGNTTLLGTYGLLRKARIQRFVVTGGKTKFQDMNALTLRRFDRLLYSDWLESLKFYHQVIDVSLFNITGDFDNQLSTKYVPLSRLLEGDHVTLEKKISVWENLERALEDYQQPYLDAGILCSTCPQPERAFIVPDVQQTIVTSQYQRQYGCICATKDGRPPVEVAIVQPESPLTSIAKIVLICVGSLFGAVLLFIIIDWCLGWKIIRCECNKHKRMKSDEDIAEQETLQKNGKPPQNGQMGSPLTEPEIFMTEIDESGIEHDLSSGRLVDYPPHVT